MSSEDGQQQQHHKKAEVATNRPSYREGRWEKAVKVYTINQESKYLLVQNVHSLKVTQELLQQFSIFGEIEEYRLLKDYPSEPFTEVYWIKMAKIQSAKLAKKKMDNRSFYGKSLHVCYAPEYETLQDTREKLQERRDFIAKATARSSTVEASRLHPDSAAGSTPGPSSTIGSSHAFPLRPHSSAPRSSSPPSLPRPPLPPPPPPPAPSRPPRHPDQSLFPSHHQPSSSQPQPKPHTSAPHAGSHVVPHERHHVTHFADLPGPLMLPSVPRYPPSVGQSFSQGTVHQKGRSGLECGQEGMEAGNDCIGLSREDRVNLYLAGEGGSRVGGGGGSTVGGGECGDKRSGKTESSVTKPKPSKPKKRRRI